MYHEEWMYWKVSVELCSKYDRERHFDVILGRVIPCCKLWCTWICCKHSNNVARQVETPGNLIVSVARHNFHVGSEVKYTITVIHLDIAKKHFWFDHLWNIATCCSICCILLVSYKSIYSMNTYVLVHFEYKNNITIIIKLNRATRPLHVALIEHH